MCMLECVEQKVFSLGKDDIMKSPSQTKLNWFIESSFSSCWTWSMKNYVCHEIVRNYLPSVNKNIKTLWLHLVSPQVLQSLRGLHVFLEAQCSVPFSPSVHRGSGVDRLCSPKV